MKHVLQHILSFVIALTLALPTQAHALLISPAPAVNEATPENENSLFYQWNVGDDPSEAEALVLFAESAGFNRIIFSVAAQDLSSFDGLHPPVISAPDHKDALRISDSFSFLYALSDLAKEKGLSLSYLADPYTVSADFPGSRFLYQMALHGSPLVDIEDNRLMLDSANEQSHSMAVFQIQKALAAGIHIDEIIFPNDAFHDGNEPQIVQAKKMASFIESIGAGSLDHSIYYSSAPNDLAMDQGLLPETLWQNQLTKRIYPVISGSISGQTVTFHKQAQQWLSTASQTRIIPVFNAITQSDDSHLLDISCSIFLAQQMGYDAIAVSNYQNIVQNTASAQALLSCAFNGDLALIPTGFSLDIRQSFHLTRPEGNALTVTGDSYFLMGTSDPDKPLYLDGEEVVRTTQNGCFGVYLTDIPYGNSYYTFKQGYQSKTVTVYRPKPNSSVSTIKKMVQSSIYPSYDEAIKAGEEFTISCTAPAGAAVYAYFQGRSIQLKQVAVAKYGVPAVFKATTTMKAVGSQDETTKVGPVTYSMWFNGVYSSYRSDGALYCVGESAQLAVKTNDYINNVYGDYNIDDDFYMTLYRDVVDTVTETEKSYYKLSSGGYISKSTVDIITGKANVVSNISSVTYSTDARGETMRLRGTAKVPYKAQLTDNELMVTLWNCENIPTKLGQVQSELFRSIAVVENEDGSVTLIFHRKKGVALWGYSVEYDQNDLLIYAKKAPSLSNDPAKPLSGMVIVIDAGHGGEDPGALGIAGSYGPAERELNFISAYASAQVLTAMGADVQMVAPDDERLDFEGRMDPARISRADFFISFHHNSTAETTDSRKYSGTEVYYHEDQSKLFAENLLQSITSATGRDARGAYQDYYRVTRMTYAPSVMLELGFMVNPDEYESLCQPISIYQTAMGVAQGVIQTVQGAK